jgi:hypothetical protein
MVTNGPSPKWGMEMLPNRGMWPGIVRRMMDLWNRNMKVDNIIAPRDMYCVFVTRR